MITLGITQLLTEKQEWLNGKSVGWHILADGSMYHTGFTGTSIRIDLEKGLAAILLTNRVHPDAQRTGILECRNQFHRIVFA